MKKLLQRRILALIYHITYSIKMSGTHGIVDVRPTLLARGGSAYLSIQISLRLHGRSHVM